MRKSILCAIAVGLLGLVSNATGSSIDWSHTITDPGSADTEVGYMQIHLLKGEAAGDLGQPNTWATPDELSFAETGIEVTGVNGTLDPPDWNQAFNNGETLMAEASEAHVSHTFDPEFEMLHGNIEFTFNFQGTDEPVAFDFAYQWYDTEGNLLRNYFARVDEGGSATLHQNASDWGQLTLIPLPAPVFMGLAGLAGVAVLRRRAASQTA